MTKGPQPHVFGAPIVSIPRWLNRTFVENLLFVVPIVGVLVLGVAHRWTSDDGFVYFRNVDQLLAGHGPVFNRDERVESFASPLWLAVLTLGDLVSPFRLEYTAAILSVGLMTLALGLATAAACRLAAPTASPIGVRMPIGLLSFAVLWPVWIWSTGGQEIALSCAWLAASFFVLVRWAGSAAGAPKTVSRGELVVLGLGWVVRPDLLIASALFVGTLVLMSATTSRRRWSMIATAFAVPVGYQIFRMGYYGMLVSERDVAREALLGRPAYGWDLIGNFLGPYVLALPLLAIVFGVYGPSVRELIGARDRHRLIVTVVMAAAGTLDAVFLTVTGGDFVHARLFLPALFAFLAPVFVVAINRRNLEAVVVTVGWAILAALLLRPPTNDPDSPLVTGHVDGRLTHEDAGFDRRGLDQPWIDGPGLYLVDALADGGVRVPVALADPETLIVATESPGPIAYGLGPDVYVLDLYGSSDPMTAHLHREFSLAPGREKPAGPEWLLARLVPPDERVLPTQFPLTATFRSEAGALDYIAGVAWARSAASCGHVEQLMNSYTNPLTIGQFTQNIWDSMTNTTVRIAVDPRQAYRDLCGDDDLPVEVSSLYDTVGVVSELPPPVPAGDLILLDNCAAAIISTGSPDMPWRVLDGMSAALDITIDPHPTEPATHPLITFDVNDGPSATVSIEIDGSGRFRLRQDTELWLPALQDWTALPDTPLRVGLEPDVASQRWVTTIDGTPFAEVPMIGIVDGEPSAVVPTPSPGTTNDAAAVLTLAPASATTCREIIERS